MWPSLAAPEISKGVSYNEYCYVRKALYKIIKKKGLVILHRNKKTKDHFSDKLKIVENRTYGISKIYLIKLR